jgi:16S rRNA (cytosine1402-N4)-methyltransferase
MTGSGSQSDTPGGGRAPGTHERAHVPVLLDEVVELLNPQHGETYADGTAGLGGHAAALAPLLGDAGRIVLNDLDPGNLKRATANVRAAAEKAGIKVAGAGGLEIVAIHGSFADLPAELESRGIRVDCFLADLGFASNQVDDPERGLSFQAEGPLDMRLDPTRGETAADLVNRLGERDLADLIYRYGEERLSRRIAQKLVEARRDGPITTTTRVADLVRSAYPMAMARKSRIHPATRTFQALRIAVNGELDHLDRLLRAIETGSEAARSGADSQSWLACGSRVGIIAFHSLEDRPVKQSFVDLASRDLVDRLTRKPIVAGDAEASGNPRARSAKLRGVRVVCPGEGR